MSEQAPAVPAEAPARHPIRLVVTDDLRRNRLTVFFRLLLLIPHMIWISLWTIAVLLAAIVAWVAGVIAGRVPDGLHNFIAAYVRYATHVYSYFWIAADPFPGFTGAPRYPIDVEVDSAVSQNRLTVLFRLVLAIPAYIVMSVLQNVGLVIAVLAWFYSLVTGRMNEGMRNLLAYCLRYQAQTFGYFFLLTGRYPSFSD